LATRTPDGPRSPQARGRGERLNRTLQDRLVNELRVAGISTVSAANRYLREHFLAAYDRRFARPPTYPAPAFVPLGRVDLTHILCHEEVRTVGQDNTVTLEGVRLQIDKQPGRRTCAGLRVLVRRHLDGLHCIWYGARCFGHYDARGRHLPMAAAPRASRVLTPLPPLPHPLPSSSASILSPLRARVPNPRSSKPRRRTLAPA